MWLDHDGPNSYQAPPVQNTWYTVFSANDVNLIWNNIYQSNTGAVAKDIEVRWTIDGTVYKLAYTINSGTAYYIYKSTDGSAGGVQGLTIGTGESNGARFTTKHGQAFLIEFRMTSVPGVNQVASCSAIYETLEAT